MPSRYLALTDHLTTQHEKTGQTDFVLTFGEVSRLVDGLPPVAYLRPQWWHTYKARWSAAGWQMKHVSIAKSQVTFARAGVVTPPGSRATSPSGIGRLREFFQSLPAEKTQAALTFDEFSRIRGRDLTKKAQNERERWANTRDKPWMQAGWEVQSFYVRSRLVVFCRVGKDVAQNIKQYLRHVLEGQRWTGPRPSAHNLIDWVRLCKRLEWNFEGIMLYEKGGIDLGALGDDGQAELEQDYSICKRRLVNSHGSEAGRAESA